MAMSRVAPRSFPVGWMLAAPIMLAAGWVVGAGVARWWRTPLGRARRVALFHHGPPRPVTDDDLYREDVVRALLESDHERFDELGRPVRMPRGGGSLRQQAAAPIDLTNVDE